MRDILRFGLIGPKGEKYMFGSPDCPVRLAQTPEGLQGAPFDTSYSQNSRQDGETFRARRYKRNPVTLNALVGRGEPGPAHRRTHARWRAALGDTEHTCRFVTVSGESGYRWKDCRLQSATQSVNWQKPGLLGVDAETVTLASDDAFWTHPDETRVFQKNEFGTATLRNPGDRPVWPTITLVGGLIDTPIPGFDIGGWAIGFGDEWVQMPGVPDGGYIRIHTDPRFPTATLHRPEIRDDEGEIVQEASTVDLYEESPGFQFPILGASRDMVFREPIPAGGNGSDPIPMNIHTVDAQDTAQVMVEFTPKSVSAW